MPDGEKASLKNIVAEELYDYDSDPNETQNFANMKTHSGIKKELADKLEEFLK